MIIKKPLRVRTRMRTRMHDFICLWFLFFYYFFYFSLISEKNNMSRLNSRRKYFHTVSLCWLNASLHPLCRFLRIASTWIAFTGTHTIWNSQQIVVVLLFSQFPFVPIFAKSSKKLTLQHYCEQIKKKSCQIDSFGVSVSVVIVDVVVVVIVIVVVVVVVDFIVAVHVVCAL